MIFTDLTIVRLINTFLATCILDCSNILNSNDWLVLPSSVRVTTMWQPVVFIVLSVTVVTSNINVSQVDRIWAFLPTMYSGILNCPWPPFAYALAVLALFALLLKLQVTVKLLSMCAPYVNEGGLLKFPSCFLTRGLWPGHHSKHSYEQMFLKLKPSLDNRATRSINCYPRAHQKVELHRSFQRIRWLRDVSVKLGHCLAHTGTVLAIFGLYSWWDLNNLKWNM